MKPYFFGPTQQLFGVLHPARVNKTNSHQTIVICPPVGQEYIRTHWCLKLLARQLSRKGIQTLRMDYRGIGDSAGDNEQTTSLQQWHQDVHSAIDFACKQTNTQNVMLVGLRYGGTIAATVAAQSDRVNSLVLWEPVTDTGDYLESLREMHRRMLDLWVCKIKTSNDTNNEEILGSIYSRSLLDEMQAEQLNLANIDQPQFITDLYDRRQAYEVNEMQRFMPTEDEDSWSNLEALETGWLRATTARQVVLMADEMFSRLNRFEQLGPYTPSENVALPNVPLNVPLSDPLNHSIPTAPNTSV